MSKFTVTIQLSEQDARRLVDSLESTLMIAGECALGDEQLEDGSIEWGSLENDPGSEAGALENVSTFKRQLSTAIENTLV